MTPENPDSIHLICPHCNIPGKTGKQFCMQCGTALVEARACTACGSAMKMTAQFCPKCGASIIREPGPSPEKKTAGFPAALRGRKWIIPVAVAVVALAAIAYFVVLPIMTTPTDTGLSANPQVQVLNHQAWALNGKMKYKDAYTAADKATGIDAGSADAWANKGWALAGLGNYADAITALDKATALDPNNAITWSNRGFALLNLGRCPEAVSSFDKALALDPYDYGAINYRKVAEQCPKN